MPGAPEDRDGGLDEEPARAAGAGLGDGAAPLRVTRAVLARDEAEVGLELVRVDEALDVVDRGDECGGRHRPDAGDRAQALDALIVSGYVLEPGAIVLTGSGSALLESEEVHAAYLGGASRS